MLKTIKVTRRHILAAKRCDNYLCPIALAINQQTGMKAYVGHYRIALLKPEEKVQFDNDGMPVGDNVFLTTEKMQNFIDNFDFGIHVNGFSFKLKVQ